MDALSTALANFFSVANIISVFGGLIIGVIIGALPGLGPTLVIALAMPMVIGMNSTTAIILLIGIYVGGIYGGSISAIWINTPGTPAAAATVLDGYQMNKLQGKPMRALKLALWASIFGHFFGSIVLFMAAEPLARFSLKFGPPEQFALVLFALTVISVIAGENRKKGLISAVIGLLLCTIGTDNITGARRLTFGILALADGVDLFALLIGIFAVSEVYRQLSQFFVSRRELTSREKIVYKPNPDDTLTFKEFIKYWPLLLRSSAIGTFIGALPGIGSGTSAFVAYGWAQKLSKHPERFGKGSEEGIISAESSNNACCGGALVPLLSLGIPGDTVTAVLLGAMVMHGLAPGPLLFSQNADSVRVIYVGIFVCGLLLLLIGKWILKGSTFIAHVKPSILWPIISVICVLGVFSSKSSLFDVNLMLVFGLLGYFLDKYKFPTGPLLIAFILGPLLETSLRQSLLQTHNNFWVLFNRPIFVFFMVLAFVMVAFPIAKEVIMLLRKKSNQTEN